MLTFLSTNTYRLMEDFLPLAHQMTSHRIVNYISFYLSYRGKHLYHHKDLLSHQMLHKVFTGKHDWDQPFSADDYSIEHLLARQMLSLHFLEHVVDQRGAMRLYMGMKRLQNIAKQDLIQDFLGSRCVFSRQGRITPKVDIHPRQRKNIYIHHGKELPSPAVLEQLLTINPFYQLSNLNKVLVFGESQTASLQLPKHLQNFCKTHSIRIKLLKDNTVPSLLEYIYGKSKRNILIHEVINNCHEIYDLKTPEDKVKRNNNSVTNPVFWKLMPREIAILGQRLPKGSVVGKNTEEQVMLNMRRILDREPKQELIDPQKGLSFSSIEKNYLFEDIDGQTIESKHGFLVKRYATTQVYQQNRQPEITPGNPFEDDEK